MQGPANTLEHILDLAALESEAIPASTLGMARLSLFDWIVCGRAGIGEPVAAILRDLAEQEGGNGEAAVFGGKPAPARMAALVNGATSHALDYDDTHFGHIGHLSVGIYPAALATAEMTGARASAAVEAFLVGAETAVRIGRILGPMHYDRGFHQTATAGAFGATVAAGRLLGLTRERMRAAIGLCATRASGLKSQFGTMGKPYNAGVSASNGVECAMLADKGMSAPDDGLTGHQGFVSTHSDAPDPQAGVEGLPGTFLFEDNKYKLHACCHGTHAMIEALREAKRARDVSPDDVTSFRLRTNPRWLTVCDIKTPRTGLEVKFSYCWLAGMALEGIATESDDSYTRPMAEDRRLRAFAKRVTVEGDESLNEMQASGVLSLKDGSQVDVWHDLSVRMPNDVLEAKLFTKAEALLGAAAIGIRESVAALDTLSARALGRNLGGAE